MELTPKQRVFAEAVLRGETGSAAARQAGCTGSNQLVGRRAHKWRHHPKMSAYIAAKQKPVKTKEVFTREDAVKLLIEIVKGDPDTKPPIRTSDRIRAAALIGKIMGWDKPAKPVAQAARPGEPGSLLWQIRNKARTGGPHLIQARDFPAAELG